MEKFVFENGSKIEADAFPSFPTKK